MESLCVLNQEFIKTLEDNYKEIAELISSNDTNDFLKQYCAKDLDMYVKKSLQYDDFTIDVSDGKITIESAINMYNSIKSLPRIYLYDRTFWGYLCLFKFYKETKEIMKFDSETGFLRTYLFADVNEKGKTYEYNPKRGIAYNALGRIFYMIDKTVDYDNQDDHFVYSRFVLEKYIRFREFGWRLISNNRQTILGLMDGEKRFLDTYEISGIDTSETYDELSKYINSYYSCKEIYNVSKEDLSKLVYNWLMKKSGLLV